jgi:hypothetical protein
MAQLGPNDLKQFAIPATWDAAYLRNLAFGENKTYDDLITDIANGLSIAMNSSPTRNTPRPMRSAPV